MSRRARITGFGCAVALVLAGILGAVFVSGTAGQLLALVLTSLGFVLATSLVFLEVGLSEDRARARAQDSGQRRSVSGPPGSAGSRLGRMRGQRRCFK